MPQVTETALNTRGQATAAQITLNGTADGFVYRQGTGQILILRNPTAGALSPVIDGDAGTTVSAEGLGQINVAGGYAVGSIAVGAAVAIPLDAIYQYLQGTVAINSGVGLVATLLRTK